MNKAFGKFETIIKNGLTSNSTSIDGIGYSRFQNMESSILANQMIRPLDEIGERKKFDLENEIYEHNDPCTLIIQGDLSRLRRRRCAAFDEFITYCEEEEVPPTTDINSALDCSDNFKTLKQPRRIRSISLCADINLMDPQDTFFPEAQFGSLKEISKFSNFQSNQKRLREKSLSKKNDTSATGSSGSIWDYFTSASGSTFQIGPNCMP